MKTLKKVLSVALVLAMALSLVTIASAADTKVSKYQDFTDAADIVNKEAVDTLAALGIIAGMPDGSFDPKGYVTRAQAAKIITYMILGATSADSLRVTTAPFKDVPATHWAAAYIQYCVTRGIINGLGDGTFNPDGQVTAAQFAKMLLTAIGYGKLGEYVGNNWALNAIVDAQNLGILDTNADYMAPATRDEVARYAFNAYVGDKCYFVTLDKTLDGYVAVNSGANKGTLAAQQKVEASESIKIINGQASRKWTKDGVNLTGNYFAVEDQRVLATGAYDAFFSTISGYARETNPYKLRFDADLQFYLDGQNKTPQAILNGTATWANVSEPDDYAGFIDWGELPSTTHKGIAYAESFCKLGSLFTLVDSDKDGEVDVISVYSRTAAKLTSDVVVTAAGLITLPGTGISNKTKDQIVGYEGLKKGDVVVFYYDKEADCHYVEKTRAVSGAVTSATVGGPEVTAITLGGTDYNVYPSAAVRDNKSATSYFLTSANINRVFTGYVDSNNFVVYLEPADDASSLPYGIVLTYGANPGALGSAGYSIRILKEDGTIAVYQQAPDAGGQYTAVFDNNDDKVDTTTDIIDPFALVTYRFTDDGKIIVTEVTDFTEATLYLDYAKGSNKVELAYDGVTPSATKYIAKSTKVFYANSIAYTNPNDYGVVTGFANTKAVSSSPTQTVYFYASPENPDVANVLVFITTPVGTGRAQYAFANPLFGFAWSKTVVVNGKEYKQATFFKDGNPMFTLTAPANLIGNGVAAFGNGVVEYQLDSEGYVTSLTTVSDNIDNFTTPLKVTYVDPSGEYFVTENNGAFMTDENTVFYRFDKDTFSYTQEPLIASIDDVITYEVLGVVYNNSTDKVATQVYFQVTVK